MWDSRHETYALPTSLHAETRLYFHHIITVQSRTPFIFPLLRVTGSKIWFPPHNSLHNAISPALNCQDNLYQSRGESPGSLSGYSSGRQEKQGGEDNRYFPPGKATDTSAASLSHLGRRQVVKKCLEEMETDGRRIIIKRRVPVAELFFPETRGEHDICQVFLRVCIYNAWAANYALSIYLCLLNLTESIKEPGLLGLPVLVLENKLFGLVRDVLSLWIIPQSERKTMTLSYIYFLKTHFSKRIQLTVHDARQRFQNIAISVLDLVRQRNIIWDWKLWRKVNI